jgi:small GTP-binding protein
VWDVGGQSKLRPLWRHYYQGTQALIFEVDSNDLARFELAAQELRVLLSDEAMHDAVVLIFRNKQDLPEAVDAAKVSQQLNLYSLRNEWYMQPCAATEEAAGLFEDLD